MNQKQTQKVNMIDTSLAVLNVTANKALWSANTTFSTAVDNVLINMGMLNNADGTRLVSPVPFTETKGQAKVDLIESTLLHAAAGRGYAASVNDTTLKGICIITETSLVYSKDTDLGSRCMNIYTAVQPFISSMADWNVNAATLLAFNGNIHTFTNLVGTPLAQMNAQNAAVAVIDAQIELIEGILTDTLDTLMLQYKTSNPDFYNAYMNARTIHSTGVHHSTIFLGFIRTAAAVALPHMEVVLTLNGKEVRKHFTDINGHYKFTRLHLGEFVLTVSGPGYITQTKSFTVNALQSFSTDFTMIAS